jgi:hypothetical protein
MLRVIPKVLVGASKDVLNTVPCFRCDDCGDVFRDLLPQGLTDVEEALGGNDAPEDAPPTTKLIL